MKTVSDVNAWWDRLEREKALYVWGMNGEEISDKSIKTAYASYKSKTYDWEYYSNKLSAGKGKIGADCSGSFCPVSGGDNTASGYYSGCTQRGKIATLPTGKACLVFKRNSSGNIYHIGWYRPEDATVSEMASSQINFRRKKLAGAGWTDWGIPRWVNYAEPVPAVKAGWVQEDGEWKFYYPDGSGKCVVNAWYKDGEKWYWFDGAGHMIRNTWYRYNGSWYYLGSDGAMLKGQLLEASGKWYYLDQDGAMASKPITLTPDQDGALKMPDMAQ